MYNLNEEEELTHYGQSLAEMEKFNDVVNSDDESEEKGLLSGESECQMNGFFSTSTWFLYSCCTLNPFSFKYFDILIVTVCYPPDKLTLIWGELMLINFPAYSQTCCPSFFIPSPQLGVNTSVIIDDRACIY